MGCRALCACRFVLCLATVMLGMHLVQGRACASDSLLPVELPEGNVAALGFGAYPDYTGSDDYTVGVLPLARIDLGSHRSVSLLGNELRMNLLDHRNWRFGPVGLYRFGREDVKDDAVDRMKPIEGTVELGAHCSYDWRDESEFRKGFGVGGWALTDAGGRHRGFLWGVNAFGTYPVARPLTVAGGVGTTWGSGKYMDTYFGVSPEDSLLSGLRTYSAHAGFRDARVWLMGMLHLGMKWHLGTAVMHARLLGDATDSPMVDDRGSAGQWVYGGGAMCMW